MFKEKIDWKSLLFKTFILALIAITLIIFISYKIKADTISINAGGNNNVVSNPNREIEGFLFGRGITGEINYGNQYTPYTSQQLGSICNYSEDFIEKQKDKYGNFSANYTELEAFRKQFISKFNFDISYEKFMDLLKECEKPSPLKTLAIISLGAIKKPQSLLWFFILLFFISLISLLIKKKTALIILYKKLRNE